VDARCLKRTLKDERRSKEANAADGFKRCSSRIETFKLIGEVSKH
jgi:hypothetical protein